jgi:Protein of unknown function (DUF1091)
MQCMDLKCNVNPKVLTNVTCALKRVNPGLAHLSIKGYIIKETNDIIVSFQSNLKIKQVYKPTIIRGTGDVCEFMKGGSNRLMSELFPKAKVTLASVLRECPYKTGWIQVDDYPVNGEAVSQLLQSGYYRFDLAVKSSKEEIYLETKLFCAVKKKLVKSLN